MFLSSICLFKVLLGKKPQKCAHRQFNVYRCLSPFNPHISVWWWEWSRQSVPLPVPLRVLSFSSNQTHKGRWYSQADVLLVRTTRDRKMSAINWVSSKLLVYFTDHKEGKFMTTIFLITDNVPMKMSLVVKHCSRKNTAFCKCLV